MELYEIKPLSTSLLAVGSGRKWAEIETWESTRSGREGKGLATVIVGELNEVPDHVGLNTQHLGSLYCPVLTNYWLSTNDRLTLSLLSIGRVRTYIP